MTIEVLATERQEKIARAERARVGADRLHGSGGVPGEELSAGPAGDALEMRRLHG
jgi:hypothetical protein